MNPEAVKAMYGRHLDGFETVVLRRYSGTGPARSATYQDTETRGRVAAYEPHELVGSVQQGDRKLIVLATDLVLQAFEEPLRENDKVVVRGRELTIVKVDDNTRRVRGELAAYELQVRG